MKKLNVFTISMVALIVGIDGVYAACNVASETWSCLAGYYGSPTSDTSSCTRCPQPSLGQPHYGDTISSAPGSNGVASCYAEYIPTGCASGTDKQYYSGVYVGTITRSSGKVAAPGYYVNPGNSTVCVACGTNKTSDGGGTGASCYCVPGYWQYQGDGECYQCPETESTYEDDELIALAHGTSNHATSESQCFLEADTSYYDQYGEFQLTSDCKYDESATDDFL